MNICHDMKCYLAKDRIQTQNVDIAIKFTQQSVFIDDQHPSSGSISVFLITKYNIDIILSLYHITMYLHGTICITISIYRGSTSGDYLRAATI